MRHEIKTTKDGRKNDAEKTFEMRTDAIQGLAAGDIWATRSRGIFRVMAVTPARWSGEDQDIYGHIYEWLECRSATTDEAARWHRAVAATKSLRTMRKQLNIPRNWQYIEQQLVPPREAVQRLDSYDSRWVPPQPVELTPAQCEIEEEYISARRGIQPGWTQK